MRGGLRGSSEVILPPRFGTQMTVSFLMTLSSHLLLYIGGIALLRYSGYNASKSGYYLVGMAAPHTKTPARQAAAAATSPPSTCFDIVLLRLSDVFDDACLSEPEHYGQ
jgi:hypothetical protein